MSKADRLLRRIQGRCAHDSAYAEKMTAYLGTGNLIAGITTPPQISPSLNDFCRTLNGNAAPVFVAVAPPLWSRRDCCYLNVERIIKEKGGESVFGYKIWANDVYAEGVPHCIWRDRAGQLVDVTFNQDGERRILFVPVPSMTTTTYAHGGQKPRYALDPDFREVVALETDVQSATEYVWMSEEDSWNTQLTYEEWLSGKR